MDRFFIKLFDKKCRPKRMTEGSTGYDVYSRVRIVLPPHTTTKIPLGFALAIPTGWEATVRPRSGSDHLHYLGTLDSDYRGEVQAKIRVLNDASVEIPQYTRIAQIVFSPVCWPELVEADDLSETKRGINGFGSTGRF